ncbi:helix-turn-helix transcriptional regulator [Thermodesulfobacteriota bacterium]
MIRIDGEKIRQLREKKELTQLYCATVVGVTTDTISRWENKKYPTIKKENALKLAEALEADLEDILENPDSAPGVEPAIPVSQPRTRFPLAEKKRTGLLLALVSFILVALLIFPLFSKKMQTTVSAIRILPPHAPYNQPFPIIIKVQSGTTDQVSFVLKETLPPGCRVIAGVPRISMTKQKSGQIKWISKATSGKKTFFYLAEIAPQAGQQAQLPFHGNITFNTGNSRKTSLVGDTSMTIKHFHWADINGDFLVDDDEILRAHDLFEEIELENFNLEFVDNIWAGDGYSWDEKRKQFLLRE